MNVLYPSFESSWAGDRPAPAPSLNERHTDALEALAIKRLIAREGRSLEAHRSSYSEDRPLPPVRPQHVEAMAIDPITNVRIGTFHKNYEFNRQCKKKLEQLRRGAREDADRAPELFSGTRVMHSGTAPGGAVSASLPADTRCRHVFASPGCAADDSSAGVPAVMRPPVAPSAASSSRSAS